MSCLTSVLGEIQERKSIFLAVYFIFLGIYMTNKHQDANLAEVHYDKKFALRFSSWIALSMSKCAWKSIFFLMFWLYNLINTAYVISIDCYQCAWNKTLNISRPGHWFLLILYAQVIRNVVFLLPLFCKFVMFESCYSLLLNWVGEVGLEYLPIIFVRSMVLNKNLSLPISLTWIGMRTDTQMHILEIKV